MHNGRKSDGGAPGGKKGRTSFEFTKPEEPTWLLGLFLRRLVLISPAHFLSIRSREEFRVAYRVFDYRDCGLVGPWQVRAADS